MRIVTAAQMVALEQAAISRGVSADNMMENAGLAVAQAARKQLGGVAGVKVAVLVGPGNNGGDGLVTARHLRRWGAEVAAWMLTARPDVDPKLDDARLYGVRLFFPAAVSGDSDPSLSELDAWLAGCRLAVDAVLGTGRARPLDGLLERASGLLSAHRSRGRLAVLALDMPSGLDADTGQGRPGMLSRRLDGVVGVSQGGTGDHARRRPGGTPGSGGHRAAAGTGGRG